MNAKWLPLLAFAGALPALAGAPVPAFLSQQAPPARYHGVGRAAAYAPVRDGARLAITVYRPESAPVAARLPTLALVPARK